MEEKNAEYQIANVKGKLETLYKDLCNNRFDKHVLRCIIADTIVRMDLIYDKVQDIRKEQKIEVPKCLLPDTSTKSMEKLIQLTEQL